jgi:hypothetical protein
VTAKPVAVGAVLLLVAAAFATGIGPAPSGDAGGMDGTGTEAFPTRTPTATAAPTTQSGGAVADAAGTTETTETATPPAFAVTIDRVESCGWTCRDVTSTLRNDGGTTATSVVVHSRVFVGNGTDGDVAWRGEERVGRLEPAATHTATHRVELSYGEAVGVRNADGWVTVQTTVVSDQRTVTFAERRNVT